jgi:hypothetical protein
MCTCIRVAKLAEIRSIFGIVKVVISKWRFSRLGGYEMMQWWALCVRAGKKEVVGKPRSDVAACPSRTRSAPVTRRGKCVCELRSCSGGSSSGRGRRFSGKDFFFKLPNFWVLKARLFALLYELLAPAFF